MPEWPVYVDGWQLQCCGSPFAVGDNVEWTLMLSSDRTLPSKLVVEFSGTVEHAASDEDLSGYVVGSGELHAWVEGAQAEREFEARGALREDHHGGIPGGVPPTRGTVRRIQMVTRPYVRADERMWIPKSGEVELRDLSQSPGEFRDAETLPELREIQTGLLVSLDVDDSATSRQEPTAE